MTHTVLRTERLHLRRFTPDDAENLFALDSDPEVLRYVGPRPAADPEGYRERIVSVYLPMYGRDPGLGYWAVEDRGAFVGWVHFRPAALGHFPGLLEYAPDDIELGYRLVRSVWGRGYATEVARAVVRRGFEETGVETVVASALQSNAASLRVLEKAGLERVAKLYPLPGYDAPAVKFVTTRTRYARR